MRAYPARFTAEAEGGFTVTFRDVPEAITHGRTRAEAASLAEEVLELGLSHYIASKADLPKPSAVRRGERLVAVSAMGEAKLALWDAMRRAGIGKAALARRLGWHLPQVDRLLDCAHDTRWATLERALAVVGKRLVVRVADAA